VAALVNRLNAALTYQINVEDYLVWSTVVSAMLFIPVVPSIFLGYVVVILNCLILLVFDRLTIHRNHLIAILSVAGFSLIGAYSADATVKPIIAQILGITVLSVYYFSALTNLGISLPRWMEMYVRVAFLVAVLGLLQWAIFRVLHMGDGRLKSIFFEPSHYVFLTLPAVGYCIDRYVSERQYGSESLIFVLTYVLADSSLGYLGLLLIGLFAVTPRLKGWQIILAGGLACILAGGLYVGSANFRLRANDTVRAIASQDLGHTNASTFAMLSNVYVTSQSFMAHPLTGVGIGGYGNAYDKYIGTLSGPGLDFIQESLNRDDANSLFLRVAAELGVPGLLVLFGFIIGCARVRGQPYLALRNALLPYMLIRMGRFGAYFSVEVYFFVCLYVLNYMESRAADQQVRQAYRSVT
jgi:hypothetical protein